MDRYYDFITTIASRLFLLPFLKSWSFKGGFPLGEMTDDFAAKSRQNYFATKLYLIFTWRITLSRLLKTFAIKNNVYTFINVKSNWEFCGTFISLIKIVEHKKHKFPLILLPFVLFNNQTSARLVTSKRTLSKKIKDLRMELFHSLLYKQTWK